MDEVYSSLSTFHKSPLVFYRMLFIISDSLSPSSWSATPSMCVLGSSFVAACGSVALAMDVLLIYHCGRCETKKARRREMPKVWRWALLLSNFQDPMLRFGMIESRDYWYSLHLSSSATASKDWTLLADLTYFWHRRWSISWIERFLHSFKSLDWGCLGIILPLASRMLVQGEIYMKWHNS